MAGAAGAGAEKGEERAGARWPAAAPARAPGRAAPGRAGRRGARRAVFLLGLTASPKGRRPLRGSPALSVTRCGGRPQAARESVSE